MVGTNRSHSDPARRRRASSLRLLGVTTAAALAIGALSGCAAGMISQSVDQVPNHDGVQVTVGAVGVHNALLPAPEAVAGKVAYPAGSTVPLTFWVTNQALDDDQLSSISTSAGPAQITGDAVVPAQSTLQVGVDTPVTVSITTNADLSYGFPVAVDFYFANAGKMSVNVPIEIPAQRTDGRATTDIYPEAETNLWDEPEAAN